MDFPLPPVALPALRPAPWHWLDFALDGRRLDEFLRAVAEGAATTPTPGQLITAFLEKAASSQRSTAFAGRLADAPPANAAALSSLRVTRSSAATAAPSAAPPAAAINPSAAPDSTGTAAQAVHSARLCAALCRMAVRTAVAASLPLAAVEAEVGRQAQLPLLQLLAVPQAGAEAPRWQVGADAESARGTGSGDRGGEAAGGQQGAGGEAGRAAAPVGEPVGAEGGAPAAGHAERRARLCDLHRLVVRRHVREGRAGGRGAVGGGGAAAAAPAAGADGRTAGGREAGGAGEGAAPRQVQPRLPSFRSHRGPGNQADVASTGTELDVQRVATWMGWEEINDVLAVDPADVAASVAWLETTGKDCEGRRAAVQMDLARYHLAEGREDQALALLQALEERGEGEGGGQSSGAGGEEEAVAAAEVRRLRREAEAARQPGRGGVARQAAADKPAGASAGAVRDESTRADEGVEEANQRDGGGSVRLPPVQLNPILSGHLLSFLREGGRRAAMPGAEQGASEGPAGGAGGRPRGAKRGRGEGQAGNEAAQGGGLRAAGGMALEEALAHVGRALQEEEEEGNSGSAGEGGAASEAPRGARAAELRALLRVAAAWGRAADGAPGVEGAEEAGGGSLPDAMRQLSATGAEIAAAVACEAERWTEGTAGGRGQALGSMGTTGGLEELAAALAGEGQGGGAGAPETKAASADASPGGAEADAAGQPEEAGGSSASGDERATVATRGKGGVNPSTLSDGRERQAVARAVQALATLYHAAMQLGASPRPPNQHSVGLAEAVSTALALLAEAAGSAGGAAPPASPAPPRRRLPCWQLSARVPVLRLLWRAEAAQVMVLALLGWLHGAEAEEGGAGEGATGEGGEIPPSTADADSSKGGRATSGDAAARWLSWEEAQQFGPLCSAVARQTSSLVRRGGAPAQRVAAGKVLALSLLEALLRRLCWGGRAQAEAAVGGEAAGSLAGGAQLDGWWWHLALAHLLFRQGRLREALRLFVTAGSLATDGFRLDAFAWEDAAAAAAASPGGGGEALGAALPAASAAEGTRRRPWQPVRPLAVFPKPTLQRLVACLQQAGAAVPAAVLCQALRPQPFLPHAFRLLQRCPLPEPAEEEPFFRCLWEVPLLEMLASRFHAVGDAVSFRMILAVIGNPRCSPHNPPHQRQAFERECLQQCLRLLQQSQ